MNSDAIKTSLYKAYEAVYSHGTSIDETTKLMRTAYQQGINNPCAFKMLEAETRYSDVMSKLIVKNVMENSSSKIDLASMKIKACKKNCKDLVKQMSIKWKELYGRKDTIKRLKVLKKLSDSAESRFHKLLKQEYSSQMK